MELKLVFCLLLVWGVCATLALSSRPQTRLERRATELYGAISFNGTCSSEIQCADKGDDCVGDFHTPNGCNISNSSCCGFGLRCSGGECTTDNIGDSCSNSSSCFSDIAAAIACVSGECQYVYGIGDSCDTSADCAMNLNCSGDSICEGASVNQKCNVSFPCNFGLTCFPVNLTYSHCVADIQAGGNCTGGVGFCVSGTYCSNNGTCVTAFTLANGQSCSNAYECSSGYCANNGSCATPDDKLTSCSANSDCTNGANCTCSWFTGDSYCDDPFLNPCAEQEMDYQECLSSNNCSSGSEGPDSCAYNNCYSDMKKSYSCGCDVESDVFSACIYNHYCGGFPVWAIIVIIVVAIVLVLAIVLLVFFMMRRRRVYDSI